MKPATVALLLALVACAPRRPHRDVVAPPAPASAAPDAPPPPPDTSTADATPAPTAPFGCDRRQPAVGTRYEEIETVRVQLPGKAEASFMIQGSSTRITQALVEVAPGAEIPFVVHQVKETREIDGDEDGPQTLNSDPNDERVILHARWGETLSAALAAARPFRAAMKLGPVEKAIATHFEPFDDVPPRVSATYAGRRTVGGVELDVLKLSARIEDHDFATCHGLYTTTIATGELLARADDSALVELTLSGSRRMKEDVCAVNGRGRDVVRTENARYRYRLTRECFRVAVSAH